ncbi:cysteine proteinase [Cubamyces sp. BRFM 1775]|nr:cysteine proteinase [Cubamyces sp. BRFM 1775]
MSAEPVPFSNATNLVQAGSSSGSGGGGGGAAGSAPISQSPEAPKLKVADLPDVDFDVAGEPQWVDMQVDESEELPPAGLFDGVQTFPGDGLPVDTRPLISPLESMTILRAEYENGTQEFVEQIDWLMNRGWIGLRRTRGDGDCFYRSLAFAYIEQILNATEPALAVISAVSVLESTQPLLEQAGYQSLVFEDFYESFVELINAIITPRADGRLLTITSLLEAFNTPEVSNSVVMYLRMLTSTQIKLNAELYAPVLFDPEMKMHVELENFCNNFVEAFGKEADDIQITALSGILKVNIDVAYVDGRKVPETVHFVTLRNAPDPDAEPITLLYRPGHYDILDRRSQDPIPPLLE